MELRSKQTLQPLTTFILKTIAIATLSLMTACVVRGQIRKRGGICPPIHPDTPDHWNQHKESITIPMSLPALMEGISPLHPLHPPTPAPNPSYSLSTPF